MAYQAINLGTVDNDNTGDKPKPAGIKINANFADLDSRVSSLEGSVKQYTVSASGSLTLSTAYNGYTIILGGTGATVSIPAASLGDGFVCKIINDTGADWVVPTPTGGTLRFDVSGQTLILIGGSGSLETYTRSATRYVHVVGTTA